MKGVINHLSTVSEQLEGPDRATQVRHKPHRKDHGAGTHILQGQNKEHGMPKMKSPVSKQTEPKKQRKFPARA